jgi:hypothetical protein
VATADETTDALGVAIMVNAGDDDGVLALAP